MLDLHIHLFHWIQLWLFKQTKQYDDQIYYITQRLNLLLHDKYM